MPDATAEPLTRGHKQKERTRRRLVDAAIDVIADHGEGFVASDIAARAGVSNGTFYNYFDDRDELIDTVVDEVITGFAAQSHAVVQQPDPVARFATISTLALQAARRSPNGVGVVLRLDAVQRALIDGDALSFVRDDIREAHDLGRFTAPVDRATVDVVVGALLLASRRAAHEATDPEYDRRIVGQLLRSLGLPGAEADEVAGAAAADAAEVAARR